MFAQQPDRWKANRPNYLESAKQRKHEGGQVRDQFRLACLAWVSCFSPLRAFAIRSTNDVPSVLRQHNFKNGAMARRVTERLLRFALCLFALGFCAAGLGEAGGAGVAVLVEGGLELLGCGGGFAGKAGCLLRPLLFQGIGGQIVKLAAAIELVFLIEGE